MARDPLDTVLRLRRRGVDAARIALVQAIAVESAADESAREAEQAIVLEENRASDPSGDDALVEAFAAWLPGARERVREARAEQERLAAEVSCRRAELAASRTALEVIETLLRQKRERLADEQSRQSQRAIDEAAARRVAGA